MNSSADEFRQSIEASLPPLTQYSIQASAPGLYGAFGWGSFLAGSRQLEIDSVRASADDGERSPSLRTSASLRSSFPPFQASEVPDVGDTQQPSVNLTGASNVPGTPFERVPASPTDRMAPSTQYSLTFHQEPASPAALHVNKPPTAPAVPPQGYIVDASVTVQTVGSPGNRLYPPVPSPSTHIQRAHREEATPLFASPIRPKSPPAAPEAADVGMFYATAQGLHSSHQSPNGKTYFGKQVQQPHGNLNGVVQGKVVHMRRAEAWTKYVAYEGCLQVRRATN
jgi:hypothetical protein